MSKQRVQCAGPTEQGGARLWDIAWADNMGHMRRLQFEADLPVQAFIDAQVALQLCHPSCMLLVFAAGHVRW